MEANTKEIDTRTFPELWQSLSPAEQGEVRYQIMRDTLCTRQSVHNWANGATPIYRDIRIKVAKSITKVLGLNVSHLLLFPDRR